MALAAMMLAASLSTAYAAGAGGYSQQQEQPKDCKKDPNDPRCKGG